ncbi:MAG: NRDE family protein [Halobacteriaceae archaeon]
MCTLILAWQVFPEAPVCVAANRDEADDRPSSPPGEYATDPRVVAPRDEVAGGTWLGYNDHGVLAAVTNRWTDTDLPAERSRGRLVADALGAESAEDAARVVEDAVSDADYAGFNLVLADDTAALYCEWDGRLRVRNWRPGVHVVVNVGADGDFAIPERRREFGEQQAADARRARTALRPEPDESGDAWRDRAAEILRDHDYAFCVHGDGYGTQSSSLLSLGPDGADWRYADGPPCETAYESVGQF